jgi:hypothetical protein
VSEISFDNNIPHGDRVAAIIEKVKNPYCFCVGDMGVKLEFSESAPPLQDILTEFLTRKKSGL